MLRTRKTKGAGSRSAGLAMAYKLLDAAQARWRCVNAPHLVALVRAEATFVDGFLIEREDQRYAARASFHRRANPQHLTISPRRCKDLSSILACAARYQQPPERQSRNAIARLIAPLPIGGPPSVHRARVAGRAAMPPLRRRAPPQSRSYRRCRPRSTGVAGERPQVRERLYS
jgi:hypothetical protein